MASSSTLRTSLLVQLQQKLGFRARHELVLWSICATIMFIFVVIRAPYLHPPTFQERSAPGEWYYFRRNPYRLGIFLHLYSVIPCGFLAIFQFIPIIRTKSIITHRVIGYLIMTLLSTGNIGVALFANVSMGGNDLPLSGAIVFLIIATSGALFLAWYNIRVLQIEEHRKWMLRAMFWMSIIITQRILLFFAIVWASYVGTYVTLWSCEQVKYFTGDTPAFHNEFPSCSINMNAYVGVPADLNGRLHIGSAVRLGFSMSTWVAIALHAFAVELYIHLTPKENDRLRLVSYHRQRAAGLSPAGSVGITADRWGDGFRWNPPPKKIVEETGHSDSNGVPKRE